MRLDIVFPQLPPRIDGIGDYTANLIAHLKPRCDVRVLHDLSLKPTPIEGVRLQPAYDLRKRRSFASLADTIAADSPDWVLLQFNQFSFGHWGLSPWLPLAMRRLGSLAPRTRFAVMFHEDFVPPTTWKFRIMRQWQRWQFRALGEAADLVAFSIDPWVRRYAPWFQGTRVVHMPVGSNMPRVDISRDEARHRLGIPRDRLIVGVFGTVHSSRSLGFIVESVAQLRKTRDVGLVYIGGDASVVRAAMPDVPAVAEGPLAPDEVSRRLGAVDLYLAPFVDGVSSRRGSLIAALQHGLPAVTTTGELTDDFLRSAVGHAFDAAPASDRQAFVDAAVRLGNDPPRRDLLARGGSALFEAHFSWPGIASRWLDLLTAAA